MKCKDCTITSCPNIGSNAEFEKPCTIINQDSFDLQSFRAEAAKDILTGIVSHSGICISSSDTTKLTKLALKYADELVKLLKEKEEK